MSLGRLGGLAGLGVAYGAVRLLLSIAPANLPRLNEIAIDGPVLLFTAAISLLASVVFGAVPVIRYAAPHLSPALRGGGRSVSASRERHRVRSALVVVQVGLALLLLIGSGLMIRTFETRECSRASPSRKRSWRCESLFRNGSRAVQVVGCSRASWRKSAGSRGHFGGIASKMPLEDNGWHRSDLRARPGVRGIAISAPAQLRWFRRLVKTMGNRLIAGRDLTWTDVYEKLPVAMVTENLARELWQDPAAAIGKRVRESRKSAWREVVGVVNDERDDGINVKAPTTVIFPSMMADFAGDSTFLQRSVNIAIRSARTGQSGFADEVGRAVWAGPVCYAANARTLAEVTGNAGAHVTAGDAGDRGGPRCCSGIGFTG